MKTNYQFSNETNHKLDMAIKINKVLKPLEGYNVQLGDIISHDEFKAKIESKNEHINDLNLNTRC